jgi:Mce-associated membrane protein
VEDQPADPGDLTTETERHRNEEGVESPSDADEAVVEKPRRRWFPFGRKTKSAVTEYVSGAETTADTAAPRVPVGKSRRTQTTQSAAVANEPDTAVDADTDSAAGETPATDSAESETPATDSAAGEPTDTEQILVPHRPAGRRLIGAAVAAGVLFVAAAAFAGAMLQPYLADRAAVDTKLNVARTAANAITTLWTYTPDNMEALPDRSARYLGGDFANEYRKYIDAIVAPNKQAQVTNTTQVMGTAVETLTPTEATAIVYTNSVATSPVTKNIPSLRYLSYRLTMQRHDADWLITKMSTVTSLDLTPQL